MSPNSDAAVLSSPKGGGIVLFFPYGMVSELQVFVFQSVSFSLDLFSDHGRIIEFRNTVTVKDGIKGRHRDFRPVNFEARLVIPYPCCKRH